MRHQRYEEKWLDTESRISTIPLLIEFIVHKLSRINKLTTFETISYEPALLTGSSTVKQTCCLKYEKLIMNHHEQPQHFQVQDQQSPQIRQPLVSEDCLEILRMPWLQAGLRRVLGLSRRSCRLARSISQSWCWNCSYTTDFPPTFYWVITAYSQWQWFIVKLPSLVISATLVKGAWFYPCH